MDVRRHIYISVLNDGFSVYFPESKQIFMIITSNDISNSLSLTRISLGQLQSDNRALKDKHRGKRDDNDNDFSFCWFSLTLSNFVHF